MSEFGFNFDNTYKDLTDNFYQSAGATPVDFPNLVAFNDDLAKKLGLDRDELNSGEGTQIFSGNKVPDGSAQIAQAYAGHQFGNFTMLGDGRAVLIGEHVAPDGGRYDIQLKGAGRTAFSRMGDGRAPIGPMLREYIISEALHALEIPTSRSLAVVTTGEAVTREDMLPGGILTRVAASHLRVGTFEYAVRTEGDNEQKTLADYAIERHYPELNELADDEKYLQFLHAVVDRQAALIAKWQLVGFIHGVMNSDNMTISGETIDYGPCAFMDEYHPATKFSSVDVDGRYQFQNQPGIGQWNLARFAETLLDLIHEDKETAVELSQEALSRFGKLYESHYLSGMREKLGIIEVSENDGEFVEELLNLMLEHEADYTETFRLLSLDKIEESDLFKSEGFEEWYAKWQQRIERQNASKEDALELMKSVNPAVIPRNHLVEEALNEATHYGDYSYFHNLNEVLKRPFDDDHDDIYKDSPKEEEVVHQTFCGT